jgi:hypothetical protein
VGIVRSRVVINSGKREIKLLSVEEIFNSASGLQKLQSVEEITFSGKEESKLIFEKVFIYRLSDTDKEEKEWNKTVGSWNNHYIEDPVNIFRLFPRLYISSCIFNTHNSQCV